MQLIGVVTHAEISGVVLVLVWRCLLKQNERVVVETLVEAERVVVEMLIEAERVVEEKLVEAERVVEVMPLAKECCCRNVY